MKKCMYCKKELNKDYVDNKIGVFSLHLRKYSISNP